MPRVSIASLIGLLFLSGCASKHKDYDYMTEARYQKRPQLHQSLVNGSEPLSEDAVQKNIGKQGGPAQTDQSCYHSLGRLIRWFGVPNFE